MSTNPTTALEFSDLAAARAALVTLGPDYVLCGGIDQPYRLLHCSALPTYAPPMPASFDAPAFVAALDEAAPVTTADLRPLLEDLAAVYSPGAKSITEIQHEMRTGTSTRPMECVIDAGVPQGPLKAALRASGLEMYLTYDGKGGTIVHIRTQQAGDELRQKLRDDREATRLRHLAHVATEARKLRGTISRPMECEHGHPECSTHAFGRCSVDVR